MLQSTFMESENWPIDINSFDPFNEKNITTQTNIFGEKNILTKDNPIFTCNDQIQRFFAQVEKREFLCTNKKIEK